MFAVLSRVATLAALLALSAAAGPGMAYAQQGDGGQTANLSEEQPLKLLDAEPVQTGQGQLQFTTRYDRTAERENALRLLPGVQYGIAPGWQGTIQARFFAGNVSSKSGSGDVQVDVLRQFARETAGGRPALALQARVTVPSGQDSRGLDTMIRFVASRSLSGRINAPGQPRLHLNTAWHRNASPQSGEQEDGYLALIGYSREVASGSVFVSDVYRERDPQQGQTENVAEVGWIRQVTEQTQVSIGAGAGFRIESGDSSPRHRLTLGLQQSF